MAMFDGINPKTFLNTHQEWHAFVVGFFESFCPWPARQRMSATADVILEKEYHYYALGRGLGFIALLLILIALCKLGKEILL